MLTSIKAILFPDNSLISTLTKQIVLVAAAVLFVSVLIASYGVDLSPGLF